MANTITQSDVLTRLHNFMGKRTAPGGTASDLERYCQDAFDYAWRYHDWTFAMVRFTVVMATAELPVDFDLLGHFSVVNTPNSMWTFVPLSDFDTYSSSDKVYTLEFLPVTNTYKVLASQAVTELKFIYQKTPPTLSATGVPFPSAQTVAIGAAIYAKQGENPTTADVAQEFDLFHNALDRHTAMAEVHTPGRRGQNRYEIAGTYTGAV